MVKDERTRQKFLLYGNNDYLGPGGLVDHISEKYIPDFLGGPCQVSGCCCCRRLFSSSAPNPDVNNPRVIPQVDVPDGGLIPKSLYMSDEEYERQRSVDNPLCEESIYNCISLGRGQVHEVVINNQDRGAVICWDFDIMKQDVSFCVLHTKKSVNTEKPSSPTTPLSSINPLLSDLAHASVIDKSWKEGLDYTVVEPVIVCHDGESIQVSRLAKILSHFHSPCRCRRPAGRGLLWLMASATSVLASWSPWSPTVVRDGAPRRGT